MTVVLLTIGLMCWCSSIQQWIRKYIVLCNRLQTCLPCSLLSNSLHHKWLLVGYWKSQRSLPHQFLEFLKPTTHSSSNHT